MQPTEVYELSSLFLAQARLIVPFWIVGLTIGAWLSVSQEAVLRAGRRFNLGALPAPLQVAVAAVAGAISPVTLHGAVPIMAAAGANGSPQHVLTAFMVTSILINPNLFVYTMALGMRVALMRLALCILAGIVAGIAVLVRRDWAIFDFAGFFSSDDKAGVRTRTFLASLWRGTKRTAPNILIGITLTILFDKYFPREWFDVMFLHNRPLSVLFAAGLSVPAYYCGGGTIPLIGAWLEAGMPLGSAMAFMLVGPATKFTNLTAVKIVTRARGFFVYLVYTILFGVIAGFLVR